MAEKRAKTTVTVRNKLGLHIRPSRAFSQLAKEWDAIITVRNEDRVAAGDSQLDLLMLLASAGSKLEISANGPQADEAVSALAELVENGFGEEEDG